MQKQSQYKKPNQTQEGSNGLTELSEEHEEQVVGGRKLGPHPTGPTTITSVPVTNDYPGTADKYGDPTAPLQTGHPGGNLQ